MHDPIEELLDALTADGEMQQTNTYLEAGRAHASLVGERMNREWVAALSAVAFGDDAQLDAWSDLGAELRLRGLPPPEHLVEPNAMVALRRRVRDATPAGPAAVAENAGPRN